MPGVLRRKGSAIKRKNNFCHGKNMKYKEDMLLWFKMKKNIWFMILAAVALFFIVFALRFATPEDTWICSAGEWVKHGAPYAPKPTTPCRP